LAMGDFEEGSAAVIVVSFNIHVGQNRGEGWTNTVQGSENVWLGLAARRCLNRQAGRRPYCRTHFVSIGK
jgi:hypothetical protein